MKAEMKLGLLTIVTLVGAIALAYLLGLLQPFRSHYTLHVMYNYAGGIDVGSPVRVMGVKVGKITQLTFTPDYKSPDGEEVKLRLTIEVEPRAWESIRQDSRFYINMAGVIGEKFLEISPGQSHSPVLTTNAVVRGEDPPRVDQLISQSYGLAGKFIQILEKNEGGIGRTISQLDGLLNNFNKTLAKLESLSNHKDLQKIVQNSVQISDDVAYLTQQLRSPQSEQSFALARKLLQRLENLDATSIKKFFQEEGIKARMF